MTLVIFLPDMKQWVWSYEFTISKYAQIFLNTPHITWLSIRQTVVPVNQTPVRSSLCHSSVCPVLVISPPILVHFSAQLLFCVPHTVSMGESALCDVIASIIWRSYSCFMLLMIIRTSFGIEIHRLHHATFSVPNTQNAIRNSCTTVITIIQICS